MVFVPLSGKVFEIRAENLPNRLHMRAVGLDQQFFIHTRHG